MTDDRQINPWSYRRWSAEDHKTLRELYAHTSVKSIARQLGRSVSSIYTQAQRLGLRHER